VEGAPTSSSQASTAHRTALSSRDDADNSNTIDSASLKSENPSDYEPSLVHSPQRASNEESAWIEHIGCFVPSLFADAVTSNGRATPATDTGPDAKDLWPLLLKYFDGRYALEEISAREGCKKKKIREFLNRLVKEGILITVRHW
jgi:hypothetical protein